MAAGQGSLRVEGVSKVFGTLEALKPLSVEFHPGEVHAVVGENGAGKSTLMNILGGFLTPSSGTVFLGDSPLPKGNPQRCRALGIEMIHQHFKLVPAFTIEENLRLSQLGIGQTSIDKIKQRAEAFGWTIPWSSRVQDTSVGIQQRVEILKSVATDPKVIIFDEPTAVLAEDEVRELIQFLRHLASEGRVVILIAHKIEEVLAASDHITVLRRGELVGSAPRSELESDRLVDMMVGELVETTVAPKPLSVSQSPSLMVNDLHVRDDRRQKTVRGASLSVRRGEVVGIGGVDGNGQVELAEALAGVRRPEVGSMIFEGAPLDFDRTFVGYVPQDRHSDGLAMDFNLADNIAISGVVNHERFSSRDHIEKAAHLIEEYSIKARSPKDLAKELSGGNQQKVILARVLDQKPSVLVVVNPTRGLDVKAGAFVHAKIREIAESGACVVLFTTDRDELFASTHRQWFMSRGKLYEDEKEALAS